VPLPGQVEGRRAVRQSLQWPGGLMTHRCTVGRSARRVPALLCVLVTATTLFDLSTAAPASAAFSSCGSVSVICQPAASDDTYNAVFNQNLVVAAAQGVLVNDSGPNGTQFDVDNSDTLSYGGATISWTAVNGTYTGGFTYKPNLSSPFSGTDSFTYGIQDALGDIDVAIVTMNVPAVVKGDTYYIGVNQPLVVGTAQSVLANDIGVEPASLVLDSTTAQGVPVNDNGNGSFDYIPSQGFEGTDTFGYTVYNLNSDSSYDGTVTIHVDSTPPTVSVTSPSTVTLGLTVPVKWHGSDANSGIKSYDLTKNVAPPGGGFGGAKSWRSQTTTTSGTITGTYGNTYCFAARARDRAGNTSKLTPARCMTIPLRVASLKFSSGWSTVSSSGYFGGSAKRTATKGARMSRGSLQAKHLYLIATMCNRCGTVQVRFNNIVKANINLYRSQTANKRVIPIAGWSTLQNGTLTVIVTSATGKVVIIEGLGVLHT
jgi:Bacterial Ig domain